MNRRNALLALPALLTPLAAQRQADLSVILTGGKQITIAIPDFRGSGEADKWMPLFNQVLFEEIFNSGVIKVAPKSFYPLRAPQQPQDFRQPAPGARSEGLWLSDWAAEPTKADWLAVGYSATQAGQLVLFGWLYSTTQNDLAGAQAFGKVYNGSLDEAGTRKVAREFAADILARFGAKSLVGSKIYFVSNRSGAKEIWSMDYDGSNQKQMTRFSSIATTPTLSRDNSKLALTTFLRGTPGITILTADSARRLTFVNPESSVVTTPDFTPDGKQILLSTKLGSGYANIFISNADGSNLRPLTSARAVEVEPRVNPKNGTEVVFVSGRSGPAQIYKMNIDGADVQRLTDGSGQAANPSWHPDGRLIAFSWTGGLERGNFNIFVMDVASREFAELTHGTGRNQNPSWAPDGRHIAYSSKRGGNSHIWTMLADGTQVKQLTTIGSNEMPVWTH